MKERPVMPANELKQKAEALGIAMSFDENFWGMGPCVVATFPTHNGGGCDSALAWMKYFSDREQAESYALNIAIRSASPGSGAGNQNLKPGSLRYFCAENGAYVVSEPGSKWYSSTAMAATEFFNGIEWLPVDGDEEAQHGK